MVKRPILYSGNETDFLTMGLGVMANSISALVTEERNGQFVLDINYQLTPNDLVGKEIKVGQIIKVDASHKLKKQLFRIKRITRGIDKKIAIYAEHVSYLTNDLQIKNNSAVVGTADVAIKEWKMAIMGSNNPFTVSSDITTDSKTNWDIERQTNARLALGGSEGSLLQTYGGEFLFDNYDIKLLAKRGKTADTIIAYGRNLQQYDDVTDVTDVFTSIRGYVKYTDEKTKQVKYIMTNPEIINHANVANFPTNKTFTVDLSDKFDMSDPKKPKPTPAQIATQANAYMKNNGFGVPKVSIKVSYADLSKTLDYDQYQALEEVNLCDEVPIFFEHLGMSGTAKVIKTVWNVLADSYESLEMGEPTATLAQRFSQIEAVAKSAGRVAGYAQGVALTAGDQQVFYGDTEPPATLNLTNGAIWYKQHGTNGVEMYTWDEASQTWKYVIGENDTQNLSDKVDQEFKNRDVQIGTIDQTAKDALQQAKNVADQIALIDASARNLMSGSSFQSVTSTGAWEYPLTIPIKANTDYSFGGKMTADKTTTYKIEILPATGSTGTGFTLATAEPLTSAIQKVIGLTATSKTAIPKAIIRFTPADLTTKTTHSESMLTESTVPQDWQPAPEDIQKGIAGLQDDLKVANQSITDAKTKLDNLAIGGRNYLRESAHPNIFGYTGVTRTIKQGVAVPEWQCGDATEYTFSGGTSNIFATLNNSNLGASLVKIPLAPEERYLTTGAYYVHSVFIKNLTTHPIVISNNHSILTTVGANETKRVVLKGLRLATGVEGLQMVFQNATGVTNVPHHFIVWHAQIEQGQAVTDWKPSPVDAQVSFKITDDSIASKVSQTSFDTLKGVVNGHTTQFTQTADLIALKADQTSVDTLDHRVTTNEADIDLANDQIKLKVSQSDFDPVKSAVTKQTTDITQLQNQIALTATKTELAGKASQTDFASLQLSVGQITTKVAGHDKQFSTITQTTNKIESRIIGATGLLVDPEMDDIHLVPTFGATTGISVAHEVTGWRVKNAGTATARAVWNWTATSSTRLLYEYTKMNQRYSIRVRMSVPASMIGKEFTAQVGDANMSMKPTTANSTVYERVLGINNTQGGVSIWLPIGGECLIEEIYVTEMNTDVTSTRVSTVEQDVSGLKVTVADKVSTAQLQVQADRITTVVTQADKADWYARASSGKQLSADPMFEKGTNSFALYDQQGGQITMTRDTVAGGSQPTGINSRMKFVSTGQYMSGSRSTLGGWSQVTNSRLNAVFLVRFTALLPSGYVFQNGSNTLGTGATRTWITSQKGTGNWEEYAYVVKCGTGGTFSSFGFNYVQGTPIPTTTAPMTWYVAKYETIDITSNISSQFTQLSDQINLRVSKNDIVNQINLSTEGILIAGQKVHITGQTSIDNAVIKDAMIDTMSVAKLTAGTMSTAVLNAIKINANQLISGTIDAARIGAKSITADKLATNAVMVGFNAIGNVVKIDSNSLDVYDAGKRRMSLDEGGLTFWEENGTTKMGQMGTNFKKGAPTVRGLTVDIDFATEYIAWGYQETSGAATYTTMLTFDPRGTFGGTGRKGIVADMPMWFDGGIGVGGGATGKLIPSTVRYNNSNYTSLLATGENCGIMFGSSYLYLLHNSTVVPVQDIMKIVDELKGLGKVHLPTAFFSTGGGVSTYKTVTL